MVADQQQRSGSPRFFWAAENLTERCWFSHGAPGAKTTRELYIFQEGFKLHWEMKGKIEARFKSVQQNNMLICGQLAIIPEPWFRCLLVACVRLMLITRIL